MGGKTRGTVDPIFIAGEVFSGPQQALAFCCLCLLGIPTPTRDNSCGGAKEREGGEGEVEGDP